MRRFGSLPLVALGFLGVGLLGGFTAFHYRQAKTATALDEQLERARQMGLPLTLQEVFPTSVPTSGNAAPIYEKLAKAPGGATANMGDFERAAGLPECRFLRSPGTLTAFTEYRTMKEGVKVLAKRAESEAAAGDPVRAMRTLQRAARVSAHAGQEPLLISKLVQIALQSIVVRSCLYALADHGRKAEVGREAQAVLAALGPDVDMRECLRAEFAYQRSIFADIESGKVSYQTFLSVNSLTAADEPVLAVKMRTRLGRMEQSAGAARLYLDFYQSMPDEAARIDEIREAVRRVDEKAARGGTDLGMAKLIMPFFSQAFDAAARSRAQRRTLEGLLNALAAPVPPAKLPLSGQEAIDPFSGAPYRYKAGANEIRVWSVGRNGTDEGGKLYKNQDDAAVWPLNKATFGGP